MRLFLQQYLEGVISNWPWSYSSNALLCDALQPVFYVMPHYCWERVEYISFCFFVWLAPNIYFYSLSWGSVYASCVFMIKPYSIIMRVFSFWQHTRHSQFDSHWQFLSHFDNISRIWLSTKTRDIPDMNKLDYLSWSHPTTDKSTMQFFE